MRALLNVVYFVWDWFEAISQDEDIVFEEQLRARHVQRCLRRSDSLRLLRTAYEKGIPTFYLWDEGLMQYGYGKNRFADSNDI